LKPWGLALPHLNGLKEEPQGSFFHLYILHGGSMLGNKIVDVYGSQDYQFNTARPVAGTGGQFCGKNKGVLIWSDNSTDADLYIYNSSGITYANRIKLSINPEVYPFKIWGISAGAGVCAAILA